MEFGGGEGSGRENSCGLRHCFYLSTCIIKQDYYVLTNQLSLLFRFLFKNGRSTQKKPLSNASHSFRAKLKTTSLEAHPKRLKHGAYMQYSYVSI